MVTQELSGLSFRPAGDSLGVTLEVSGLLWEALVEPNGPQEILGGGAFGSMTCQSFTTRYPSAAEWNFSDKSINFTKRF